MPYYLVHGLFVQPHLIPERGMDWENGPGVVAVVHEEILPFSFSGVLYPHPDSPTRKFAGELMDYFGQADLFDIVVVSGRKVRFTKKYRNRDDLIQYELTPKGNFWVGSFRGDKVGRGTVRLMLTEVPASFFVDPSMQAETSPIVEEPSSKELF